MGFLDFLKRGKGKTDSLPEPEPGDGHEPLYTTRKGNEIEVVKSSGWSSDGTGIYETRTHIGRSKEGYHGGLEVSNQGGDSGIQWSNARRTFERGDDEAGRMEERWHKDNAPHALAHENGQIDDWFAKQRRKEETRHNEPLVESNPGIKDVGRSESRSWDR